MTKTYVFDCNNSYFSSDPLYNWLLLSSKMNYFNDLLKYYGFLPRYEVLKELGFDFSVEDLKYGWVLDGSGDVFVDFGISDQIPKKKGRKRTKFTLKFNCIELF